MPPATTDVQDANVLPLWNAVCCLDCEVISNRSGGECPICKRQSLVNLAPMIGGSLFVHRAQQLREREGASFDIAITVDLQQMYAKDLTTILERLTSVIGSKLAQDGATLPVNVKPTGKRPNLQGFLSFPEREAA